MPFCSRSATSSLQHGVVGAIVAGTVSTTTAATRGRGPASTASSCWPPCRRERRPWRLNEDMRDAGGGARAPARETAERFRARVRERRHRHGARRPRRALPARQPRALRDRSATRSELAAGLQAITHPTTSRRRRAAPALLDAATTTLRDREALPAPRRPRGLGLAWRVAVRRRTASRCYFIIQIAGHHAREGALAATSSPTRRCTTR